MELMTDTDNADIQKLLPDSDTELNDRFEVERPRGSHKFTSTTSRAALAKRWSKPRTVTGYTVSASGNRSGRRVKNPLDPPAAVAIRQALAAEGYPICGKTISWLDPKVRKAGMQALWWHARTNKKWATKKHDENLLARFVKAAEKGKLTKPKSQLNELPTLPKCKLTKRKGLVFGWFHGFTAAYDLFKPAGVSDRTFKHARKLYFGKFKEDHCRGLE